MGSLTRYLCRRLLAAVPLLIGATLIAFLLGVAAPGDPAREALGMSGVREPTEQELQAMREQLGLHRPLAVQYGLWLVKAAQGDLGVSYITKEPVAKELLYRLPHTLALAVSAVLIAALTGIPLGIWMAARRNRWEDHLGRTIALLLVSVPGFWLAILFILLFSETWGLLPTSGFGGWRELLMPSAVLASGTGAVLMRLSRAAMLEVMSQNYMITAKAKGLGELGVLIGHGLKNMLIPVVTVLGSSFGGIVGGAVIVEVIFAIPGIGRYAVEAIYRRDYPVIQGYVLFTSIVYVLFNLLVDLVYTWVQPQIRLGGTVR